MNLKYKKYPILKQIEDLKTGKDIDWLFSTFTDIKGNSIHLDNERFFQNLLGNPIYYYSKELTNKISKRDFNFLKTLKPYMGQDLTDKGLIISNDYFNYLYNIEFIDGVNNFDLILILSSKQGMFISSLAKGYVDTTTSKFMCNIYVNTLYLKSALSNQLYEEIKEAYSSYFITNLFEHIVFKKYAPIETNIVKPSKGTKSKRKKGCQSKIEINVIDSNWFKNIIRSEGFSVKGHFTLRACGIGRKERRLVWINPFEKKGYTRTAKMVSP